MTYGCDITGVLFPPFKKFEKFWLSIHKRFSDEEMNMRTGVLLNCFVFQRKNVSKDERTHWYSYKACFCVWRGLLHRNSTRALRGGGESPSYWVTQSGSPIFTFPLIALHLPNHVKWACMLTPHSVCAHTHTHTHQESQWQIHSSTHTLRSI